MSSSYLGTSYYFPLKQALIERILAQPIGLPTPSFRAVLDKAFAEISQKKSDSLIYHPDYTWLESHISYLSELTGWDLLALHRAHLANEHSKVSFSADDIFFDTNNIQYLAFAYADGALAEKLAAELNSDQHGFFVVSPTGEKDAKSLLLQQHGFKEMNNVYGYLQHPLRQWLFSQASHVKDVAWPTFAENSEAQHVQPMLQRWREFVSTQRLNAIHQASVGKPIYLGQHHFTNGQQIFFKHLADDYEAVLLESCDINTFKEVEDQESNGWFATDANHLWNCGEPLPCEHPAQFKVLPEHSSYFTDGKYVYHDNRVIEEVDASKVRAVPGDIWNSSFLHEDIFYPSWGSIYEVDGASFRAVGNQYYADKEGVYELADGELIVCEGFDPASFEVIDLGYGESYLKDQLLVAYARKSGLKPKFIKSADASKFTKVAGLPFCTDGKRVWLDGKECKDLDATSIRTLPLHAEMIKASSRCLK